MEEGKQSGISSGRVSTKNCDCRQLTGVPVKGLESAGSLRRRGRGSARQIDRTFPQKRVRRKFVVVPNLQANFGRKPALALILAPKVILKTKREETVFSLHKNGYVRRSVLLRFNMEYPPSLKPRS